ncbi:PREDICTED: AP-3 complex subunit sigma-2 [Nipponia nippon]|nr:PREDICTED: AP-3 complex subunit sigma-2 [Nipponia nippon]
MRCPPCGCAHAGQGGFCRQGPGAVLLPASARRFAGGDVPGQGKPKPAAGSGGKGEPRQENRQEPPAASASGTALTALPSPPVRSRQGTHGHGPLRWYRGDRAPADAELEPTSQQRINAEEAQQQIIREIFHLVLKRDDHICNFLECGSLFGGSDYKLIYRHYATLYFVFCVDSSESELGILDLIQVFVETLDKCFENVCELDLIFHMDKVHHILQEVVIGGMVLETNMNEIVAQVEAQSKLEKAEGGLSAAPSRAVSAVKNINLPEIPRNINIGDINIKVPNLSQFM